MLLVNRHSRAAMFRLFAFAALCLGVLSLLYFAVKGRIEEQAQQNLLTAFHEIAPDLPIDAALLEKSQVFSVDGRGYTRYPHPQADFFRTTTPKGYNGDITLLVGIAADGSTLLGVRVLAHRETPGLGDKIERRLSPWIEQFVGKSLADTRFQVKKDGGDFDAFSGATITPRAVTEEVGHILQIRQHDGASHDPKIP